MKWKLAIAAGAALIAASVATPIWMASGFTTAPLCRISDISYYYGGAMEGLGHRAFDITLLAHDGVRCRLSDRPLIHLSGPRGQKRKIPVYIGGRGGTLILTPRLPLHTTVRWLAPDTPQDTIRVQMLRLRMPGGGIVNGEPFLYPGVVPIALVAGVSIDAWTTGIGAGQETSSF
jgi:hypothetical protein